jgi:hypothetical protein
VIVLDGTGVLVDGLRDGLGDLVRAGLAQPLLFDDGVGVGSFVEHRPQDRLAGVLGSDLVPGD